MKFPIASLPGAGFRCPRCGNEALPAEELARLEEAAHRLGYYGAEDRSRRRLLKVGNSLAVTLDPHLARELLGSAKAGQEVYVGRMGPRIVIEPLGPRFRLNRRLADETAAGFVEGEAATRPSEAGRDEDPAGAPATGDASAKADEAAPGASG